MHLVRSVQHKTSRDPPLTTLPETPFERLCSEAIRVAEIFKADDSVLYLCLCTKGDKARQDLDAQLFNEEGGGEH